MSVSLHCVWSFRAMDALVASVILVSGACYRAQATAGQPQQSSNEAAVRFPGVDLVRTNRSAFFVRIHSGMVGNGDPLYVIDGAPMRIPASRGIDWFEPEDIADIKVLKAPHEVAEYGANGANGVIVIITKQARKR